MKRTLASSGSQILIILVTSLGVIWGAVFYDLERSHAAFLREAEVSTSIQAQVFAEYSRSTLKRVNEFILNARKEWRGDWQSFAAYVKRAQENIDDIAFQVAIIDADGLLLFSNLSKPSDRTDLSSREHFRVHRDAPQADALFISRPLKGKVSGKWSIQATRPIFRNGQFDGVIVVSLSPDQFAGFAEKLGARTGDVMTLVRHTGEIMARYPPGDGLGLVLNDRPFLGPDAPQSGVYRRGSSVDGKDRIWGFRTLPEYGMTVVIGERVEDILAPYESHRFVVLVIAATVSLMAAALLFLLYRSLKAEQAFRVQLTEIFALSPDGFVSFDARRHVNYISPAFLEMTGLDAQAVLGLDEAAFAARVAGLCSPHAALPALPELRHQQKLGDGRTADAAGRQQKHRNLIELSGAGQRVLEIELRISQSAGISQILCFRDVTHEIEVDRMKSEFLSTAAHELRTPMASIYGFTELLLHNDFGPEERHEFLNTIFKQSALMVSIINELLDLARIEARRGKDFEMATLDLGLLLEEVVGDFRTPEGRAPPVLHLQAVTGRIRGDRKKLTQVIVNVLSNAYKYSPAGGDVVVELMISKADLPAGQAAQVGIRVSDPGIGMTPAQLSRVCERFYRADTSGKIPGTGLGMSIVKEILELHGGRVELASDAGTGTTVTLWLPALPADSFQTSVDGASRFLKEGLS